MLTLTLTLALAGGAGAVPLKLPLERRLAPLELAGELTPGLVMPVSIP